MELWVASGFGAVVGALLGYLLGRLRQVPVPQARPAPPSQPPPSYKASTPSAVKHVVLDDGSANVLNALNNRLAAIGALADLLHGSPLDPERARSCCCTAKSGARRKSRAISWSSPRIRPAPPSRVTRRW